MNFASRPRLARLRGRATLHLLVELSNWSRLVSLTQHNLAYWKPKQNVHAMEAFAHQPRMRDDLIEMPIDLHELSEGSAPQTVTFLLLCAVAWVLLRPYDGLVRDAQLYALQSLAALQPAIFSGDIFLRYGSQNDFTLFPRLYAFITQSIGIERATAYLTLSCSVLWLAMGWLIARGLTNREMALPALGLLVSVSAWYGAYHVFRSGEMYLSARLPAEVLSLAATAAFLHRRRMLAGVLVLISGMLHPLMALPAAMLLVFMLAEERWGVESLRALFPILIFGGTAATLALSGWDHTTIDEWLLTLQTRSIFLFPAAWRFEDWQHNALILATIGIAYGTATSEKLLRFSSSMLLLGLSGIGLAAIAGALPEHDFLLKIQPWRWLWLAAVAAIILLPSTVETLWREDYLSLRRTCAILLLASWMAMDTFGGVLALATLGTFSMRTRVPNQPMRALRTGAWLLFAATLVSASITVIQCAMYPLDTNFDPRWIQRMVNGIPTNSTAVAAVLACWFLTRLVGRTRLSAVAGVVIAAALLLLVMPRAHRTWSTERFSPETIQAFMPWRTLIPETAEVLWPINPAGVWILLGRRSYMSGEQLAGLLYSRQLTKEMNARAEALKPLVAPGWWTMAATSDNAAPKQLTAELLAKVCQAPGLDFVVTSAAIEGYVATALFPVEQVRVYLYDCHATVASRSGA